MRVLAGALAVVLLTLSTEAQAQSAKSPPAVPISSLPICPPSDPGQDAADQATLKTAMQAFQQHGYFALGPHIPDLQRMLDHAPKGLAPVERCGDKILVTSSLPDFLLYSMLLAPELRTQTVFKTVNFVPSPYPTASLLIGAWYNENSDYASAVDALQAGLSIQPTNAQLTTEEATALSQLGRFDEALALCDRLLQRSSMLDAQTHARVLRSRGTALEGERRFDDAEAAYRESLTLAPGNPTALNELVYIARQRAGAPTTAMRLVRTSPQPAQQGGGSSISGVQDKAAPGPAAPSPALQNLISSGLGSAIFLFGRADYFDDFVNQRDCQTLDKDLFDKDQKRFEAIRARLKQRFGAKYFNSNHAAPKASSQSGCDIGVLMSFGNHITEIENFLDQKS